MMTLKQYLDEYSDSHKNPTNIKIHKICVPVIMFSLLGILKALPVPAAWPLWFDWSLILIAVAMTFYIALRNVRVIMLIGVELVVMLFILEALRPRFFLISLFLFIVAWIGQFIGHKIEGKKPSFFKDLLFLLIGPIWTLKNTGDQMGSDFFGIDS
jgi:uncharacterized membrane protein YGL010W